MIHKLKIRPPDSAQRTSFCQNWKGGSATNRWVPAFTTRWIYGTLCTQYSTNRTGRNQLHHKQGTTSQQPLPLHRRPRRQRRYRFYRPALDWLNRGFEEPRTWVEAHGSRSDLGGWADQETGWRLERWIRGFPFVKGKDGGKGKM
jgi:hypothetical protein